MLRMALLGLLILFSVGVLSAMELSAPPRRVVVTVQPLAERRANISASYDASAKADRLEVAAASSAMPTEAASVENPGAPQDIHVRSPAPIVRHRPDPKTIAAAKPPKPKPKPIVVKRTANVQRAKAASETEPCRLKAFGGLLKALNLTRCEI
jgi:outer membrane biosynthesis protein TonB